MLAVKNDLATDQPYQHTVVNILVYTSAPPTISGGRGELEQSKADLGMVHH